MARPCLRLRHAQRGSFLLEGMVAILIFSLGIIALMGLQATAIRASADAKYRADAAFLANRIIGDIWADRANIATYAYNTGAVAFACSATATVPGGTPTAVSNWLASVAASLPCASPNIQQIQVGAGNVVTVTIRWQGPQEANPRNHVVVAQING